ncbi:molybdopterin molybdotransferase MoeA [Dyella sedimenti]|uniref:molybdopterin molybdotransferase MoeA n=1 Tax=Dyella sedimenti TaxID=2919947 RepID=UPI001FAA8431|nr:gephyrin-like molybdotransferase Glp [Dyella sedimenti]
MIDYAQAMERLLASGQRLPPEPCAAQASLGRILARDVVSPMALPSFDHAAMDGYALNAFGSLAAGSEHDVFGSQAAGDPARGSVGMAWEIMTGAQLPEGLDTVVPVERTQLLAMREGGMPARIRLTEDVAKGANVRLAGSDVAAGANVMAAGTRIGPAHIMLLAALGVARVEVARRPTVALIGTGNELQDDAARPLAAGQIHHSNGPYLKAAFTALGATVLSCVAVDDTVEAYVRTVRRACEEGADLIVSTGAVSMGRYDLVPEALHGLGADLLFHKVAIRPGKPLLAARLPQGPLVFALPGTPMAVAVGFRFFIVPLLRAWQGQGEEGRLRAVLASAQQPKPGLRHFLRATLSQDGDGRLLAHVQSHQQPFRIRPFAEADGWVVLPEEAGDCPAGTRVEFASLQPGVAPSITGH